MYITLPTEAMIIVYFEVYTEKLYQFQSIHQSFKGLVSGLIKV